MMADHETLDTGGSPPTPLDVLLSAAGYAGVAAACSFAGYAITHSLPPQREGLFPLLLLWALLFPAYVSRSALYDQTKPKLITSRADAPKWQRNALALQLPLILLAIPLLAWVAAPPSSEVGWRVILASTPMYTLSLYLVWKWPTDRYLFDFRFRNFFPALATCLPPFVFGFTTSKDWGCPALASAFVLIAWAVALKTPTRRFVRYGFLVFVMLLFIFGWLSVQPQKRCLDLLIFGLLMTLAMGVCEAWRFTARVLNDEEYRPGGYTVAMKHALLGGTNLATALFLPAFLLTSFHLATTRAYIGLAAILLLAQYVLWFADHSPEKKSWWPYAGTMLGFGYPAIIATATTLGKADNSHTGFVPNALMDLPGFVSVVLALATAAVYALRAHPELLPHAWPDLNAARFVVVTRCYAVTCLVSAITCGLLATAVLITNTWSFDVRAEIAQRGTTLEVLYLIIVLAAAAAIYFTQSTNNAKRLASGESSDASDPRHGLGDQLRILLLTARPGTALIAGALVFVATVQHLMPLWIAVVAAVALASATMFGFVINDIFDLGKDRAAGVDRPIAKGQLALHDAFVFCLCLGTVASAAALAVDCGGLMFITLVLLVGYTPLAHKWPLVKGLYTAFLSLLPFIFASVMTGAPVRHELALGMFTFIVGREFILDVRDVEGDARWGLRTVPVLLGTAWARLLGSLLMVTGALQLVRAGSPGPAEVLSLCALLIVIASVVVHGDIRAQISRTRAAMLCGAIAVALSV